jgi:carbamoyltransferase
VRILGVTKGRTCSGKLLRQGASVLMHGGRVVAGLAEERATRQKQAGGFDSSLERILEGTGTHLDQIDTIAISTCCETEAAALDGHRFAGDPRLVTVNHHLSHASLAFYGSGFARAIVVVADGGGNVLADDTRDERWWMQPREQMSYYLGTRSDGLQLLGRDFDEPRAVGLGELYRAFTYFLGWPSSRHASRVMALSAHGRRDHFQGDVYHLMDGRLCSVLKNDPMHPIDMIRQLGDTLALDFGEARSAGDEVLPVHQDIAAFAQATLEHALCQKLRWLKTEVKFDDLCLAGGVALNVVANGRILKEGLCRRVYVPPAPADDGQALGNAIATYVKVGKTLTFPSISSSLHTALGPDPKVDSATVSDALHDAGALRYAVFENPDVPKTVAAFLAAGWPVAVLSGRSEYGPRALGQRSILADPRRPWLAAQLNRLKDRDSFMPFAPTVLKERAEEWLGSAVDSPFMSFATPVRQSLRHQIPGVVHCDGTARVQTLDREDGSLLRKVLEIFYVSTGVPAILNTSFNQGGEPIVETVTDAIRSFTEMSISALVLGRFVVLKTLSPELAEFGVLPRSYSIPSTTIVRDGKRREVARPGMPSRDVVRCVQESTGAVVFVRHDFPLYGPYLEWLREGRKVTTIRFRKRGVEVPRQAVLPLFETPDYGVGDRSKPTARVRVKSIRYQRFGDLTAEDAERDGFESVDHMLGDFRKIYPRLQAADWVTLYGIELVDDSAPDDAG